MRVLLQRPVADSRPMLWTGGGGLLFRSSVDAYIWCLGDPWSCV